MRPTDNPHRKSRQPLGCGCPTAFSLLILGVFSLCAGVILLFYPLYGAQRVLESKPLAWDQIAFMLFMAFFAVVFLGDNGGWQNLPQVRSGHPIVAVKG